MIWLMMMMKMRSVEQVHDDGLKFDPVAKRGKGPSTEYSVFVSRATYGVYVNSRVDFGMCTL